MTKWTESENKWIEELRQKNDKLSEIICYNLRTDAFVVDLNLASVYSMRRVTRD